MSDNGEIEALRERVESLEGKYDDLEMRYQAAMAKNDALREIVLGDLQTTYDDVREAPSLWEQISDLRADSATTNEKIRRLDSAGARGQPGAARVAKIRHALVRKATKRGTVSAQQAAQADTAALDYKDVLALFDYEIDDTYATKLLDKAASAGDDNGFWIKSPSNPRDGRKTLRVVIADLDEDSPYLRSVRRGAAESDSANEDFAETGNSEHSGGGGSE